jgi:hypothetical protein
MRFKPKRLAGYTEADLIEEMRRVVTEEFQGRIPNSTEFERVSRVSLGSILRKFGNYSTAMAKAGFAYPKRQCSVSRQKYTAEQVWGNLRDVLIRAGGNEFSFDFYRKNGGLFYAHDSIKNILGLSFGAAMEKIGAKKRVRVMHVSAHSLKRKVLASLTNDDLLKELDRVWQESGRYPTRSEFTRISTKFNTGLYLRRFGSWSRAINALCTAKGIPMPRINGTPVPTSKDVLLKELRSILCKHPSEVFTYDLYKINGGTYSIATFQHHFGGWAKAVEAVGSVSGKNIKYSKDQLFDELQRLWEELGRQPHFDEMSQKGKISAKTYHDHFGSWIKAIHAFCEDRNSDSALLAPPEQPSSGAVSCEPEGKKSEIAVPEAILAPLIVVRKTGRSVPDRLRWRVFERDNFTCKACGRDRVNDNVKLEADHIVAWTKGGETVLDNLQTLCRKCNSGKSDL